MQTKLFKVAARSDNTNAFGLRQYYLLAEDGETWRVLRSDYGGNPPWGIGADVNVPLIKGLPSWARLSCECPEQMFPRDAAIHETTVKKLFPCTVSPS